MFETAKIPDGYEIVDYRSPKANELFLDSVSLEVICNPVGYGSSRRLIVRKIKKYREPILPADAYKTCEFSDCGNLWSTHTLLGYTGEVHPWRTAGLLYYRYARIEVEE